MAKHFYSIIQTASLYYKPIEHPVSVSSLCGQNYDRQKLISDWGCKKFYLDKYYK